MEKMVKELDEITNAYPRKRIALKRRMIDLIEEMETNSDKTKYVLSVLTDPSSVKKS